MLSGSIHYYRVPQGEWADRLLKAKLGGLNTIQTYIEWASHEPQEGVFDFSGMLNFTAFALEAQRQGLNLIFRLGPFIASERDGVCERLPCFSAFAFVVFLFCALNFDRNVFWF